MKSATGAKFCRSCGHNFRFSQYLRCRGVSAGDFMSESATPLLKRLSSAAVPV